MKQNFYSIDFIWHMPLLFFLLVLYLGGMIVGSFTGLWSGHFPDTQQVLQSLLSESMQILPPMRRIAGAVCGCAFWMLCCILSGLLSPSILFCGGLITLRGFSLSFSIVSMIAAFQSQGILLSFFLIGAAAIVQVPCLLCMAAVVLDTACSIPPKQKKRYFAQLAKYRTILLLCMIGSFGAAILCAALQPFFLQWIA